MEGADKFYLQLLGFSVDFKISFFFSNRKRTEEKIRDDSRHRVANPFRVQPRTARS